MKAYIVGGGMEGTEEYSGVYHLVTADGRTWATQWCESFEQALKELYQERAGMKEDWAEEYGHVEVLRLGADAMTLNRLAAREASYVPMQKGELTDGVYYGVVTVKNGRVEKGELQPIEKLGDLLVKTVKDSAR